MYENQKEKAIELIIAIAAYLKNLLFQRWPNTVVVIAMY